MQKVLGIKKKFWFSAHPGGIMLMRTSLARGCSDFLLRFLIDFRNSAPRNAFLLQMILLLMMILSTSLGVRIHHL